MDSGSEKSKPGMPSGGIFLPLVYSKKSSMASSDNCFFSSKWEKVIHKGCQIAVTMLNPVPMERTKADPHTPG